MDIFEILSYTISIKFLIEIHRLHMIFNVFISKNAIKKRHEQSKGKGDVNHITVVSQGPIQTQLYSIICISTKN